MQKSFVVFLLFCFLGIESLYTQDFQDSNMPSNITLNGGLRNDTITSTKGNFAGTTIGYNRNPSLSISGAANSQYSLQVQDNTTTWYSGGLSVGSNVQVGILSIHTFSVEKNSINVGDGGTLSVISSGNSINAQGSDYGGDSKIHFAANTSLNLNRGSSATFSNALFFIHNGSVTLLQDSKLSIESKVIRIQSTLTNNNGEVTLSGKVQNIGRNIRYGQNTASNFTNNGGSITINGDFYNGGQADTDTSGNVAGGFNTYDPGFGGGGNLTINGGSVTISGKLISMHGGDMFQNDTNVYNPINSSIIINGGTLRVNGGVTNAQGSSLTFGFLNGKMGELIGNLDSTNGNVVINMAGASDGSYTLINGTATGVIQGQNFSIINGNNEFSSTTFNTNTWQVTINTNKNAITNFTNTLDSNRSSILNALNSQYGNIFTMQDSVTLRNTTQNIMSGIYSNYIATPISVLDSIKTNMLNEALRQNLHSRAGWHIGVSALGLGLAGGSVGVGGIGGVNIGAHNIIQSHTLSFQLGYAFSSNEMQSTTFNRTSQNSAKSGNFNVSHNLALSAFDRIIFGYKRSFELDLGGYFLMSFMNARRQISGVDSASSDIYVTKTQGNFTQIALDSSLGYRFNFANASLKPYLGVTNAILMLGNFKENGDLKALSASVKTQGLYALNILTGLENRVHLRDNSIVLLFGIHYENQILSSNEFVMSVDSGTLRFNMPYKHRISLNYGVGIL
ncbi:hypothetical protein DCO58_09630 [Helicobacter saguini]|uniref:Autotransporter domain-containing protein n=1 Tax=Helicobacter saguini TaxID=1548018 RepID=A0A347VPC3_9HELI|nr:hypothetical protein [Helicobacter saguini]MWV61423.1 hypothetical protein [Helicobacter saguini]MWV67907.1 hypothetical protein [Helicobacter saguini]MWV70625.1 hypothetical protein [Helicobacter saguini]MWV72529.1 hypothetical protein [Helicobacter saguini]TLD94731.1 hypothetical protein LS64_004210 [Helicobacter saguini]